MSTFRFPLLWGFLSGYHICRGRGWIGTKNTRMMFVQNQPSPFFNTHVELTTQLPVSISVPVFCHELFGVGISSEFHTCREWCWTQWMWFKGMCAPPRVGFTSDIHSMFNLMNCNCRKLVSFWFPVFIAWIYSEFNHPNLMFVFPSSSSQAQVSQSDMIRSNTNIATYILDDLLRLHPAFRCSVECEPAIGKLQTIHKNQNKLQCHPQSDCREVSEDLWMWGLTIVPDMRKALFRRMVIGGHNDPWSAKFHSITSEEMGADHFCYGGLCGPPITMNSAQRDCHVLLF